MNSESWDILEPFKNEYGNHEYFEDYYKRIKPINEYSHIPKKVFEQWLWAHHDKIESNINYGWIDYQKIKFDLCVWSTKQLSNVNVIDDAIDYFELRASYDNFEDFCCSDDDLEFWKNYGTWKTPPIILDVNSLKKIPNHCKLKPPYQLVEGHSRLGYLNSMIKINKLGKGNIALYHKIFLMKL